MIIEPFPPGSQRTSVISQCYCGLSCVYTRVWCHMNGYISWCCSVKWVKRLHPGEATTVVAVSQQHTWPLAVSKDHSGFIYIVCVCLCVCVLVYCVLVIYFSVTLNISWQLTCTVYTPQKCSASLSASLLTLSKLPLMIKAVYSICLLINRLISRILVSNYFEDQRSFFSIFLC